MPEEMEDRKMKMETRKRLQSLLDEAVEKGEIPGGVFLETREGREECCLTSGYSDLEQGKPMERDCIFRLYSMTKPVTAAAAMALMEQGKLDLAEPVSSFFPSYWGQMVEEDRHGRVSAQREVLVKDLLNMTSGLLYPGYGKPAGIEADRVFVELDERLFTDDPMSTSEFADRMGHSTLAFHPGRSWQYGSGADVLGAVIEKASGMRFSEFLDRYFLEPLEMADTGFAVPPEKRERLAKVYERDQDGWKPYLGNHLGIINAMDREPAFESGGAGLSSTAADFTKFARMLLDGGVWDGRRILQERTVRYLTGGRLLPCQQQVYEQCFCTLAGFTYGNLMRVAFQEGGFYQLGNVGEYGWDGWLGCYFANDPVEKRSFVFMTQCRDGGILPVVRKMKNVIYAESLG